MKLGYSQSMGSGRIDGDTWYTTMTVWKNMAVVGDADGRMLGQELEGKIAWIKWVMSDDGLLYCENSMD